MSAQEARFSDTSLSLTEFANLFGLPIDAIAAAVETQRQCASARQAFFTISQLKDRWQCSRAHVYAFVLAALIASCDRSIACPSD